MAEHHETEGLHYKTYFMTWLSLLFLTALALGIGYMVNAIVTAINNQDAAYLQKVVAMDAIWVDEDGHFLPAGIWVNRLMQAKPAKKMAMTNLTGATWDNGAWAAFRYTLDETTAAGAANQMKGSASLTFKKNGNDWQVAMIHVPVDGSAIAAH